MEPQATTPRRRAADVRAAVLVERDLKPGLPGALEAAGLRVATTISWPAPVPGAGLAVLGGGRDRVDEVLGAADALRRSGLPIALVTDPLGEAEARWASRITPFVFPLALSPEAIVGFLASALRLVENARRPDRPPGRAVRVVVIDPGDSLSIDGIPVALGLAERNFLFELAARPGTRLGKQHLVDAGGSRVPARECRRRLGKRLGPELASLLVLEERNEPYRLREPDELARACELSRGAHPPTLLRIRGRASVRAASVGSMEWCVG